MALKRRLTTFVSNWLGVIIAAIIVVLSAIFGGTYLYAMGRIDTTLAWVTQSINLVVPPGLNITGTSDNPPGYKCHLTLQLVNNSSDAAEVSISNVKVKLDKYSFTVIQDGSWEKNVPSGTATFDGDIIIDTTTFSALVADGEVQADVTGDIAASSHYKWVTRHAERLFDKTTTATFKFVPVS